MPNIIDERSEDLRAGQMLGRYELLMPIAKGGMGSVWAARLKGTRGFRKLVAIKTILRTLENAHLEQMLFQEAMLASQIHHPNVAETFELGEQDGTLYLVMELVAGESVRFLLREATTHGGIPLAVGVNLVGQVCRGLAAAHDLRDNDGQRIGLVHRDISPPNVLVTDSGTVKIVDFGVATTSSSATYGSGEIKGKLSYLAPEQLRGEPLDARVDVFATGILLYLLTVGRHPFRCSSEAATIARILSDAPAASPSAFVADYPEALAQVVMRALDKNRETRFGSITDLLDALESACPSAFGPRADELVTSYVQKLTKERLEQRRATLRLAEEWAETSSSRQSISSASISSASISSASISSHSVSPHSVSSLPEAKTASAPAIKSAHAAVLGVGGVLTGLALAAAAATIYFRIPADAAHGASTPVQPALSLAAHDTSALPRPLPQQVVDRTTSSAPEQPVEASRAEPTLGDTSRPRAELRERAKPSSADETGHEHEVQGDSGEQAILSDAPSEQLPELDALPPNADAAPVGAAPVITASLPASPVVAAAAPLPPASVGPRFLASKLGQRQLLTNPSSNAVRLPSALQRSGQTFTATVNVCVDAHGKVSKVSILRSAGPALDPQIVELVSRWKYRPLVESGTTTPFCYPLNYQVEP